EDGIRDRNVTGVQTCALPISLRKSLSSVMIFSTFKLSILALLLNLGSSEVLPARGAQGADSDSLGRPWLSRSPDQGSTRSRNERSEERRVGKECRCRVLWDE